VRFSIRLSAACSGVSGDDALHEDTGVCTSSGSSSPGSTSSSTSAMVTGRPSRERVEVARGLAEDEVAVPVALPGPHQAEVGDDRLLEHVLLAVEDRVSLAARRPHVAVAVVPPRQAALGDLGADAGRG
jgi:hypothetical protein